MAALLRLLWNLCLLRSGPEQLPASSALLGLVLMANIIFSALVALSAPVAPGLLKALSLPIVAAAVVAAATWLVLRLKQLSPRFPQTLTALLGADGLITALSWPLLLFAGPETIDEGGAGVWVLLLGQLALIFWWVSIAGFIYQRALDATRTQGVSVAVLVILASLIIGSALVPMPTPAQP